MLRKPVFWIAAVVLTALAAGFSIYGFPRTFPLVTLDLRMDRSGALEAARSAAQTHGWGPEEFRQAAVFDLDSPLQAFVELEVGGNEAFARVLEEGLYHPYRWQVRHFRPGETTETLIGFTPRGEPFGFRETLPEDQEGAVLDVEAARAIAEGGADAWAVDLAEFEEVEASREVRPSGRVDHTFVYERPQPTLGEGRYRLQLVVSGDRFTELSHFVKVPEAFERRYAEMRSANDAVAAGGAVAAILILGVGGCGVGLFLLLRRRWVTWKQALGWGLVVGGLEAATYAGFWPLVWMEYDTAVSATNFTVELAATVLIQLLGIAGITAFVFMAAESLTRRAFPEHIQIWKLWSPGVAGSKAVLGRTVAGYLLVAAFLAYEVVLYFVARRSFGWWQPSDALTNPNFLASLFPWLTAVALSLRAGVTEECFFRAVPLAAAALLGQRFGGRRYWILGALLVQAVLFGAVHANYPAQPAYARLVELILPAVGWGLLYLAFGLLPCIVCHFAVDVVYFGLPIFTSAAPGAGLYTAIIVVLTLVPLWIVLGARLRRGRWEEVDESVLNRAWSPSSVAAPPSAPAASAAAPGLGSRRRAALAALGIAGLLAWATGSSFESDAPPVNVGRAEATAAARQALAERNVQLGEEWRELSVIEGEVDSVDRFVWQEGGPETYHDLIGTYLWTPRWRVRYARFEGDVAERAEEYQVWVDGEGRVTQMRHLLPEARRGASLEEDEARTLARGYVSRAYGLDPEALEEVSAEPEKQPERRDWSFTFKNPAIDPGGEGEARIAVGIAGDEVVNSYLFVHVPEEWRRRETDRQTGARIVNFAAITAFVLLFVAGGVLAIVQWSRKRFSTRTFGVAVAVLATLNVVSFLNMWPAAIAAFRTEIAFGLQAALVLAGLVLVLVVTASVIALNIGLGHRWLPRSPATTRTSMLAAGLGLGAFVAGLDTLLSRLGPDVTPTWAGTGGANAFVPVLAVLISPSGQWITLTALLLVFMSALHAGTTAWTKRRVPFSLTALALGLVLAGRGDPETPLLWAAGGLSAGVVLLATYVFVLRHEMALLPLATAALAALSVLGAGLLRGFTGALPGAVLGAALVLVLGYFWSRALTGGEPTESAAAPTV